MEKKIIITLISVSMLIFSCNKSTNLGYNIMPDEDILHAKIIDTVSISTYTILMDTLRTSNPAQLIAGYYLDPIFGTTKASFATQFVVSLPPNINNTNHPDSIVLYLPYSSDTTAYYGDINRSQEIKVYKLSTPLSSDSAYYSSQNPDLLHNNELMGSKTFTHNINDSILRIPLNPAYADTFINASKEIYESETDFINFFKGIYISSTSLEPPGALIKYDVNSKMLMKIYYHSDEYPDSVAQMSLAAASAPIKFNMFTHDYSSASFNSIINDTISVQDSVSYIQGAGGLRTIIKIPYLTSLNKLGNIQIYRAELIVKTAPENLTSELNFPTTPYLAIAVVDPTYEYSFLEEYIGSQTFNSVPYNEKEYRFDLGGYVRDIIDNKKPNYGLYLYNFGGKQNFNRTVITSGKNSNRMKLVITYTVL